MWCVYTYHMPILSPVCVHIHIPSSCVCKHHPCVHTYHLHVCTQTYYPCVCVHLPSMCAPTPAMCAVTIPVYAHTYCSIPVCEHAHIIPVCAHIHTTPWVHLSSLCVHAHILSLYLCTHIIPVWLHCTYQPSVPFPAYGNVPVHSLHMDKYHPAVWAHTHTIPLCACICTYQPHANTIPGCVSTHAIRMCVHIYSLSPFLCVHLPSLCAQTITISCVCLCTHTTPWAYHPSVQKHTISCVYVNTILLCEPTHIPSHCVCTCHLPCACANTIFVFAHKHTIPCMCVQIPPQSVTTSKMFYLPCLPDYICYFASS